MTDAVVRIQRARPLLGTLVALRVDGGVGQSEAEVEAAVEAAFARIAVVHAAMSFQQADSELSRLNASAVHSPQPVSPMLWRVLQASLALARASGGAFDPSVAARLVASGHLQPPSDAHAPDPAADWRDVRLLPGRRVSYCRPLWLDLGGIAKGYAVDLAVVALKAHGVGAGLVNAGGDLRVFGEMVETIHVRDSVDPTRGRPLLQVRDGAVATSSAYFSERNGRSALVDMRPGDATRATLGHDQSVTVSAPRTLWADALTKVVLVDPDASRPLLRRLHAQAVLLDRDGGMRALQ